MRWGKPKASRYTGPKSSTVRRGGKPFVVAQELGGGGGWFWYTMSDEIPFRNTAHAPCSTLEEAQAQAEKHVRQALGRTR